jgi:hypothetical protein
MEQAVNASGQHQFFYRSLLDGFLLCLFFPFQLLNFLLSGIDLSLGISKLLSRIGMLRLQVLQLPGTLQPPFEGQLSGWVISGGGEGILRRQGGIVLAGVGPLLHRGFDLEQPLLLVIDLVDDPRQV